MVGYNVQSVVDKKHKRIIHHELTHVGNDAEQRSTQGITAQEIFSVQTLTVLADGGYYSEKELAASKGANITAFFPPSAQRQAPSAKHPAPKEEGRLDGAQFYYNAEQNAYVCPAAELLRPRSNPFDHNGVLRPCYTARSKTPAGPRRAPNVRSGDRNTPI